MPLIWDKGRLLFRGGDLAFDLKCCCNGVAAAGCCITDLNDTFCVTIVTTGEPCTSGGGTVTWNIVLVYQTTLVKVWRGFGPMYPGSSNNFYLQMGAECLISGVPDSGAKWFICHDSCTESDYHCTNNPPDFTDTANWDPIGESDGTPCLPETYFGVPHGACDDGAAGDNDCEFELTLTEGACP